MVKNAGMPCWGWETKNAYNRRLEWAAFLLRMSQTSPVPSAYVRVPHNDCPKLQPQIYALWQHEAASSLSASVSLFVKQLLGKYRQILMLYCMQERLLYITVYIRINISV